ncbi:glycosyltransferase family 4 protein [Capnocytophaga felis]|uniref:Glycosyl transferase family 1 n=1 Tax=Capnocytophaga felis TaxID=2267611 RepID=A0A5M4B8W5_9FLAO|nr:glycosyltransferase family 1 protein [Capnocytophaga felis]GET46054.1 glycosyl transferase family 1 [Capnocytophaga felis]GET48846.1 glycosyl transferase family 1 [Capnocytophaga felis]
MKIGFDAKRAFHNNRGLGNYSRDLIRILQEQSDWELVLFNPKEKRDERINFTEKTKVITPKSFFWKKLKSIWRTLKISYLSKKEKLDIYHGLSGEIPLGIYKNTRTIVTIHDLIFLRYPHLYSFFDRKIHYWKFLYAALKSHHIIAISEQTKRDIVEFFSIPPEKISVVYQGCHKAFKQLYPEEKKQEIRQKYNLPEKFVLNVGAIEPRKNALEIVKAIKDLDISLVLIGKKTKYFEKIEKFCVENKMQNRVFVLKNVSMEDLAIIYQLATIFCYPSVFEGFGIPIIEALFSKVPVITSSGSCFAEAGGKHSVYVDLNNASAEIKQAILAISTNEEKRKLMSEKGFEYAQKFTDKSVFKQLMEVYKTKI